jgi:hypothetical protein
MEAVAAPLSFDAIGEKDLAAFHRQREKILTAFIDRIATAPAFAEVAADAEKTRIAQESGKIFIENFHATAKYRLPAAIVEYLDWLRGYLASRDFPEDFIPAMFAAIRHATHAFLEDSNSDDIAGALMELEHREKDLAGGKTA